MKIGILTSGGDCPGLNAVIRGVVLKGTTAYDLEFVGIRDGWRGVVDGDFFPLTRHEVKGLSKVGGTILGTSRTNPYEGLARRRREHREDALRPPHRRHHRDRRRGHARRGRPARRRTASTSSGVPKTIDNDLRATDYSFGFDTAVNIATEAMDRLRTTGDSHQRCMVAEVMGRHVGWIALHAGIAAGAHAILHPRGAAVDRRDLRTGLQGARPRPRAARRRLGGLHAQGHGRGVQRQGPRRVQPPAPRRHQRGARARDRAASPASRPARPCSVTSSAAARPRASTACWRRAWACTPPTRSSRAPGARWSSLKGTDIVRVPFAEALGRAQHRAAVPLRRGRGAVRLTGRGASAPRHPLGSSRAVRACRVSHLLSRIRAHAGASTSGITVGSAGQPAHATARSRRRTMSIAADGRPRMWCRRTPHVVQPARAIGPTRSASASNWRCSSACTRPSYSTATRRADTARSSCATKRPRCRAASQLSSGSGRPARTRTSRAR